MYSIIPGADTVSSKSTGGMFNKSISSEPTTSPRSGKFVKAGRKLVKPGKPQQISESKTVGLSERLLAKKEPPKGRSAVSENATMEELDQILEEDALALLNIKKDIGGAQDTELKKLKAQLMKVKKEYDSLHMENNSKQRQLDGLKIKELTLNGVEKASQENLTFVQSEMDGFIAQTETVNEELAAEQRTIRMQTLMMKRLDGEIGQARVDTAKAIVSVDHVKHDVTITDGNLAASRQELTEQEQQLEKLQTALNSRKEEREKKMLMLHNISVDGEQSMVKLQQSLAASSKRALSRSQQRDKMLRSGRSAASRNRKRSELDEDFDEFEDLLDPNGSVKRLSAQQVRDIITRFNTQSSRMERLKQLDTELRSNIQLQRKKKQEFSEHLAHTLFRIQQLASSRQIYQEVDSKDSALAATSKECDSIKEREHRLRLGIETLKISIPRFLTKVTKVTHLAPTDDQLGDAILKLEDELTKLIKAIGSALLKDATPDDLAMMSQQSNAAGGAAETHSEFGRLQRLPGFSRLQRQLFFNMMTAKPDISNQNIRIPAEQVVFARTKPPKSTSGATALIPEQTPFHAGTSLSSNFVRAAHHAGNGFPRGAKSNAVGDNEEEDEIDPALDRDTIKNISRLICERDTRILAEPDSAY